MAPENRVDRLRTYLKTSAAVPWLLFLVLVAASCALVGAGALETLR